MGGVSGVGEKGESGADQVVPINSEASGGAAGEQKGQLDELQQATEGEGGKLALEGWGLGSVGKGERGSVGVRWRTIRFKGVREESGAG